MKNRQIIDVHAHILPGIDDGATDPGESIALLRMAAAQGISSVIATPHASERSAPSLVRELAAQTEREIGKEYPDFRVYCGQEIYYHEDMAQRLREGELLTMADSRYVLVEFSPGVSYGNLYRGIRSLITAGYLPVLAHMERYRCLRKEENLKDLEGGGCLFQMNYESLQGSRLHGEVRWCRRQALSGRIHFLGTDMHRRDFRPPDITGALKWLEGNAGEELLEEMTYGNPLHMINKEGIL